MMFISFSFSISQVESETIYKSFKLLKGYPMQDLFNLAQQYEFGHIHFKRCTKTGMQAIIAVHSTKLGPALGGCRFIEYSDTNQATIDALRLAQGMSYKAAMANLPLGGGKSVIIRPKDAFSRNDYMHSFGEFVQSLGGQYITALDSGTELSDMDIIAQQTPYVASHSEKHGDPSPHTVDGVIAGIRASVKFKLGKHKLSGLHMAIQGLGHVGYGVAKQLHQEGVNLTITDINSELTTRIAKELQANIEETSRIHKTTCDVFVPCALGGILNVKTIPELNCKIIAGAANNQLIDPEAGLILHLENVLYVPDYVINAGGLIFACGRYFNQSDEEINAQIQQIYNRLIHIFELSAQENISTAIMVDKIAKEKIK